MPSHGHPRRRIHEPGRRRRSRPALSPSGLYFRRKRRRQPQRDRQSRTGGSFFYVIDVSAGDKIPRKGGPGITRSDLLVINKIDLAPLVGASLSVMEDDTRRMRGEKPFVFANMKTGKGLDQIIAFIKTQGMIA